MRGFSKTVLTVCENRFLTQFAPEIYKEKELIKRWGNAVSQRNFLNYTRHSFASLFNPYFLHLKIFVAKTNINCCRTEIYSIDFIDFIGLFAENLQFLFQEKEKKRTKSKFDGRKKKEAIQSGKNETIVTRYSFTVPYYLSDRFSRIPL